MLMPLVFLSLWCLTAGMEHRFCGYIEESEQEFRREVCDSPIARTRRASQVPLVAGGRDAEKYTFKWMASYEITWPISGYDSSCGGVLISESVVLTAAHCLERKDEKAEVQFVYLGVHNLEDALYFGDADALKIPVERRIIHEDYNKTGPLDTDVAVLFLSRRVEWGLHPHIRPICLPPMGSTYQYTGLQAIVTGWGRVDSSRVGVPILQQGDVTVLPQEICAKKLGGLFSVTSMVCGGSRYVAACEGDSGSPLIARRPGQLQHHLIGIVSWGTDDECTLSKTAEQDHATVFTKIANNDRLLTWIQDQIVTSNSLVTTELEELRAGKAQLERTLAILGISVEDLEELRARKEQMESTLGNLGDEVVSMLEQARKEFPEATHLVTLQVEIDGDSIPDIHILLLGKESPHTVEKFLKLCNTLYKDSKIDFVWRGGEITGGRYSSTGQELEYTREHTSDSPFKYEDWSVGDVLMLHNSTVGWNSWFSFSFDDDRAGNRVRVGRVLDTSPGSGVREIERRAKYENGPNGIGGFGGDVFNNIIVKNITTTSLSAPIIIPV